MSFHCLSCNSKWVYLFIGFLHHKTSSIPLDWITHCPQLLISFSISIYFKRTYPLKNNSTRIVDIGTISFLKIGQNSLEIKPITVVLISVLWATLRAGSKNGRILMTLLWYHQRKVYVVSKHLHDSENYAYKYQIHSSFFAYTYRVQLIAFSLMKLCTH